MKVSTVLVCTVGKLVRGDALISALLGRRLTCCLEAITGMGSVCTFVATGCIGILAVPVGWAICLRPEVRCCAAAGALPPKIRLPAWEGPGGAWRRVDERPVAGFRNFGLLRAPFIARHTDVSSRGSATKNQRQPSIVPQAACNVWRSVGNNVPTVWFAPFAKEFEENCMARV